MSTSTEIFTCLTLFFSEVLMATQEQVSREPWLVQTDMGMSLFNRASNIANAFAQEGNKQACGEIMKLMGSYEGLTRKSSNL